ncbi:hypothetical protein [Enterococcus faecalis]|uniref:hypothetical protein n=1 Tax=Enterococcus faecalis TaxID=1351 RepID=UPI004041D9B0
MEEKFVVKVCHANGTFLGYVSEQENAHATGIFKDKSTALRFSKSLAIKVRDSITYRSQVATFLSERAMYEE